MLFLVKWIAFGLLFIITVALIARNIDLIVVLDYYIGLFKIHLAWLIFASFCTGILLGFIFNLKWILSLRHDNQRLKVRLKTIPYEVNSEKSFINQDTS